MRRHRLTGRTPRDDQSTDGRDAAARQGSQGWKGTIGSQQEARKDSTQNLRGRGLGDALNSDF